MHVVRQIIVTILGRMDSLLGMVVSSTFFDRMKRCLTSPKNQLLGVDDRNNWNELQGNFCSIVGVSISSLQS